MLFDEINKYIDYFGEEDSKTDKGLEAYLNFLFKDKAILLYNQLGLISDDEYKSNADTSDELIRIPNMDSIDSTKSFKTFHVINENGEILISESSKAIGIILDDNMRIVKTILTLSGYTSKERYSLIDDIFDNEEYCDAIIVYDNITGNIISNNILNLDKYEIGNIKIEENLGTYYLILGNKRYMRRKISSYPIYVYSEINIKGRYSSHG